MHFQLHIIFSKNHCNEDLTFKWINEHSAEKSLSFSSFHLYPDSPYSQVFLKYSFDCLYQRLPTFFNNFYLCSIIQSYKV